MLDRPAASWAGAALALALATGCDEPPSYQLRWRLGDQAAVDDPDLAAALTSVKQCADVGVSKVRVTTRRRADDIVVDQREYACFPGAFERGDPVAVPALPAGEYVVEVERVRRSGEPWVCPEGSTCAAFIPSSEVTIGEGLLETVEVVLLQPPQCDDGVDNDLDGRVDGTDPACIFDPTGPESAESSYTLFQTSVSFLDSPAVEPANVSVAALRLGIDVQPADGDPSDDELLDDVPRAELDTSQWPFRLPLLAHDFEDGDYVLSIHAVDGLGNQLTLPYEVEFSVPGDPYVVQLFEFGSDRFLAPIVQPFAVALKLALDPTDLTGPPCSLGGFAGVAIERMWFRVTDQDGLVLDAATLGLGGGASMPVDEVDGWVSFACPTSAISSALLSWGNYALEVEARIGAVTCFRSTEPFALAPVGEAGWQSLLLERIVDDQGVPPAGCEECFSDGDCSGQICDDGICKDKSP